MPGRTWTVETTAALRRQGYFRIPDERGVPLPGVDSPIQFLKTRRPPCHPEQMGLRDAGRLLDGVAKRHGWPGVDALTGWYSTPGGAFGAGGESELHGGGSAKRISTSSTAMVWPEGFDLLLASFGLFATG